MTRHIHPRSGSLDISLHTLDGLAQRARGAHLARLAEIPPESRPMPAEGFVETQDGAPVFYIPAVDYVRQDFQRGTLARAAHAEAARRRAHRMHVAKHAALALAIGAAMWGLWG